MKILFVAPANSVHSFRWIDFFERAGIEIKWITLHPVSSSLAATYPNLHPEFVSASNRIFSFFRSLALIRRITRTFKPDMVHAHSVALYGLLAAISNIRPLIATAWGSDVLVAGKSRWTGPLIRYVLGKAKIITTDADHMISEMVGMGISPSKLRRINFGIDTDVLTKLESPDGEYALRFRGEQNAPTVISLRNHYDVYDIGTLLRAVPEIVSHVPNVRVIIAGRGPLTESLKSVANEMSLTKNVEFIGGYDGTALRRIFSAIDVYVSTSLSDAGIAASTAEAMSCCVPVVITNTGENNQWVQNGLNGYLFEAKDHVALAAHVVRLFSNGELRGKIAQAGRITIAEKNNYKREMSKMLDLYKQLLSENSD